ncbi:MAG: hypothetical protein WKF78_10930 [Candidatus Limnocylindrales bacterium]
MTAVLERPSASSARRRRAPPIEATMTRSLPASDGPVQDASGPCAEARRLSDERCELAGRARAQAVAAEAALRAAQRAYDGHELAASAAASTADTRAVRLAKDEAQERFHAARTSAGTDEALEAAARDWLQDINRINSEAREAAATMARETRGSPDDRCGPGAFVTGCGRRPDRSGDRGGGLPGGPRGGRDVRASRSRRQRRGPVADEPI